jgi:predicted dehydrogenase
MSVFNLAVAGAGLIGRRHIELITANPQTRLSAVVDPTAASVAFAASLNVPHFNSLDEMFAQQGTLKINGVILATPNHLHVSGALTCAHHGVPALIEKPVADSLAGGQQLMHALANCKVPMLVGHHRRHSSTLQAARQAS